MHFTINRTLAAAGLALFSFNAPASAQTSEYAGSVTAPPALRGSPAGGRQVAQAGGAPGARPAAQAGATAGARPPAQAGSAAGDRPPAQDSNAQLRPCSSVVVDPPTFLSLGKSQVVRLDVPVVRIIVGGQGGSRAARPVNLTPPAGASAAQPAPALPAVAPGAAADGVADIDITLLSPTELFFLGRKTGSMNVVMQSNEGRCIVKDVIVTMDPTTLQGKLGELMPEETSIKVRAAENSMILTGSVSDAIKLDQIMSLAGSYSEPKRIVNMLRVASPQQVMIEVQIAEVSKNLLDRLGASVNARRTADGGLNSYSLISSFLSNGGGLLQALRIGRANLTVDGQKDDGIARILAEPNIMAVSGQSASFLSGGRIFIPVAQASNNGGGSTITLEEKEFGVGLKFTPTVLDGNRVNLKLLSEVSELAQTGTPFTTVGGVTAILPSLTTRRADTTVQLQDGQSFVIAGLIRNNTAGSLKKFPGLGDTPILGALFRSTEFQNNQTELMFVVTPRLVKPLPSVPALPTDSHVAPNRNDAMFKGAMEGAESDPRTAP